MDKLPQVFWVGRIVHGWPRDAGREVCSRPRLWLICRFAAPGEPLSAQQSRRVTNLACLSSSALFIAVKPGCTISAAAQVFEHCVNAVQLLQPARAQLLSFNERRGLTMQVPHTASPVLSQWLQMWLFHIDNLQLQGPRSIHMQ